MQVAAGNAQRQNENWFFGMIAGINFANGTATPIDGGNIAIFEGCATQSDANGNLLFYTDGMTIWNKNKQEMENGTGLLGDDSSAQTVIVQKPGSENIYYVFHAGSVMTRDVIDGIYFSEVDISANGGLGAVIAKNIQIVEKGTEQLATTYHRNGKDVWLLTHGMGTAYTVFPITEAGIGLPVISNTGIEITDTIDITSLAKFSPDGSKIASTHYYNGLYLFDFDNLTGTISNAQVLSEQGNSWYGIEFSPNSKVLYASKEVQTILLQYNLEANDIPASEITIYQMAPATAGALQLAPDGKIYLAQISRPRISVINNPNAIGLSCNFTFHTFDLGDNLSSSGLPPFNVYPLHLVINAPQAVCSGQDIDFSYTSNVTYQSVLWDFGDGSTSADASPEHQYTGNGIYTVTLTAYRPGIERKETFTITVAGLPEAGLQENYTICNGNSLILTAPDGLNYNWSTGEDSQSIEIADAGNFSLTLSIGECFETHYFIVTAGNCDEDIVEQKGISPNGDAMNDFFDLSGLGELHLSIYNRYGLEVYSMQNYSTQWYGQTDNGHELPDGTYYYLVKTGSGNSNSGWVYINRNSN